MRNCPGLSWRPDLHINLFRTSIGWVAAYYDTPESRPDIIRVFNPKNLSDYYAMVKLVGWYNYNTDRLCPLVKMAHDGPITYHEIEGDPEEEK